MNDPFDENNDELVALLYDDLRRVASRYFNGESPGHTLQPTAVVHEAFLRIANEDSKKWKSRAHFLATAATIMRRLLVDHARRKGSAKRGGGLQRITLNFSDGDRGRQSVESDILEVHEALSQLEEVDERLAQVVELRFFGGLTIAEVASTLEVSTTTIENDWSQAKAWLKLFLEDGLN